MNGIKAATANNADTEFFKWFIWDDGMKSVLSEGCNIKESQFSVSGHLAQDEIRSHKFLNSISINESDLKNKIVISVFTPKDLRPDKISGLKVLYEFASNRDDVFILYRPHPFETKENMYLPLSETINWKLIEYDFNNNKETLFDQLFVSDLSIVFASTISLESKWMNVPCLTFEKTKDSLLYCIDGISIKHISEEQSLLRELNATRKKIKLNITSSSNKNGIANGYYKMMVAKD